MAKQGLAKTKGNPAKSDKDTVNKSPLMPKKAAGVNVKKGSRKK